jgi:hypothetical protein
MSEATPHPARDKDGASTERPSRIREIEQRAAAGDVAGVLNFFMTAQPGLYSPHQLDHLLVLAIESASRKAPAEFAGESFRQTAAFLQYVVLRLQASLLYDGMRPSHGHNGAGQFELAGESIRDLLPVVERLSRLLGDLHLSWASTMRRWRLVEQADEPARRRSKTRCAAGDASTEGRILMPSGAWAKAGGDDERC